VLIFNDLRGFAPHPLALTRWPGGLSLRDTRLRRGSCPTNFFEKKFDKKLKNRAKARFLLKFLPRFF